jgi:hypothetical protein
MSADSGMTRFSHIRTLLTATALAAAAAAPAAIAASGPTVQVHGPASLKVSQKFTLSATGHVSKQRVVAVTIHQHGKCAATYGDDKASGSYIVFVRSVGPGNFDEKRTGLNFNGPTQGHYCAYLGKASDPIYAPPRARSSKAFKVTKP